MKSFGGLRLAANPPYESEEVMEVTIKLSDDPLAENPDNVAVDVTFDPPLSEQERISLSSALAVEFIESVWLINEKNRRHGLATRTEKADGHY